MLLWCRFINVKWKRLNSSFTKKERILYTKNKKRYDNWYFYHQLRMCICDLIFVMVDATIINHFTILRGIKYLFSTKAQFFKSHEIFYAAVKYSSPFKFCHRM